MQAYVYVTYLIQMPVWFLAIVQEGRDFAEVFAELVLSNIEVGRLLANVGHFGRLQWRHHLLGLDADLLRVGPTLGQIL